MSWQLRSFVTGLALFICGAVLLAASDWSGSLLVAMAGFLLCVVGMLTWWAGMLRQMFRNVMHLFGKIAHLFKGKEERKE